MAILPVVEEGEVAADGVKACQRYVFRVCVALL